MTRAACAPDITGDFAAFAATLSFEDIPAEVVAKAKTSILDTIGCCLFGASLPSVRMLAAMAAEEGGTGPAAVFGLELSTTPSQAALVNGAAAHAFQLDEIHLEATLHPGSVALPAAFALASGMTSGAGRAILTAIVAGYEVGLRIGIAAKAPMFTRGFHNQGTTGVFVAAAAASLLRLDPGQTQHALGIAGSEAAGLMAVQEGAMAKGLHSGRAAQSGVYAAKLALAGYTGIPDVLEAPHGGFLSAFAGIDAAPQLTAGLGSRWETLRIGFKPAPASNGSITAMTAIDRIMREEGLSAADIAEVTAFVSTNTLHHCGWEYDPGRVQGVLSAQMNLRYGLAVMALERAMGVDQFRTEKLRDPNILDFISRVGVRVEPAFDAAGGRLRVACRLVVRCRNGACHEVEVPYRKGSPEDPMTADELDAKYRSLAGKSVDPRAGERIAAIVGDLDRVENLRELSRLLTTPTV